MDSGTAGPLKNSRSCCSSSRVVSQFQYLSSSCSMFLESIGVDLLKFLANGIACAEQIHFDLAHVDLQDLDDLIIAVAFDVTQVHHLALLLGQQGHQVTDSFHALFHFGCNMRR